MRASARSPRIWIDIEQGAAYGDSAASVSVFEELRCCFRDFTEAWVFQGKDAPLLRGFYYPLSSHTTAKIPQGLGPQMVLIDEQGDQLWLNAASCRDGRSGNAALTILRSADFAIPIATSGHSALDEYDEVHFLNRALAGTRPVGHRVPDAPPGKTFVRGGRLICRMDFDKGGVSADDLRQLWSMATEPGGWLGRVSALTLHDSRSRAEKSGHDGCRLIAGGESGRELWLRLPEPDDADRLSGRRRDVYEGAFTEYLAVGRAIFAAVGVDIDPPDDRSWRDRILGRYRTPPEVIRWP